MQVFKLFYKLMQANWIAIFIGFALLLAITIPINLQFEQSLSDEFVLHKSSIAVFNYDEESAVSQHLVEYLDQHTEIVQVDETPEAIADAFYNEHISYALTIPDGFGDSLIKSSEEYIPLEKQVINSQVAEADLEVLLTSYLTNSRVHSAGLSSNPDEEETIHFLADLDVVMEESHVDILPTPSEAGLTKTLAFGQFYLQYASYILITTYITVFGYAVISMRNPEIVKRDRLSMMTERKRFSQTLLGCISFSFLYWLVLMMIALILYGPGTLFSQTGLLLIASSFFSTFGLQAMAYFFVTIASNKGMITFLATFVGLFIGFASGLFVPREFVSQTMQNIASLATPIWQVQANEVILSSSSLSADSIQQIWVFFGTQILIALAYFAVSFMIQNHRHKHNLYVGV